MLRHRGSYDGIAPVFDRLCEWAQAEGISFSRTIGIYWDNPDHKLAFMLRSAACIDCPPGFRPANGTRIPVEVGQIAAGSYATTRFVGPYEDLAPIWTAFTNQIEGAMRLRILEDPAYEVYLNDPATTAPADLITDLYMPVR